MNELEHEQDDWQLTIQYNTIQKCVDAPCVTSKSEARSVIDRRYVFLGKYES